MNPLEISPAILLGGSHLSSLKSHNYTATERGEPLLGAPWAVWLGQSLMQVPPLHLMETSWAAQSTHCKHSWTQILPHLSRGTRIQSRMFGFLHPHQLQAKLHSTTSLFVRQLQHSTSTVQHSPGCSTRFLHSEGPFIGYFKLNIQSSFQTRNNQISLKHTIPFLCF